ncbi:ASCH domain-containing protein [Pantoea ananatis]|uniref:ASCH domain-containing protein n=1 Tax=Pantoea ananas TaxID=553 RepID=UPI000EB4BEA8|nr:ASCH domain-containing protein [Pantoea ananatis]MCH9270136.1 ASCH domain-containing protein [Pantoea ananatis]TDL50757.1 ASCH domain-containing protein [Pantoea ananatis]
MKVILSIKPEYAERILSGEKKFEFRKSIFKNKDVDTVIIYATMPVGKVIGEFKVGDILMHTPAELWDKTKSYAGISHKFYKAYFASREKAFAISVKSPKRYILPLSLEDVSPGAKAPQSFRYV